MATYWSSRDQGVEIVGELGSTRIAQAVLAPAELGAFWRVDAPEANASAVDFERVTVDHCSLSNHVGGNGHSNHCKKQQGRDFDLSHHFIRSSVASKQRPYLPCRLRAGPTTASRSSCQQPSARNA